MSNLSLHPLMLSTSFGFLKSDQISPIHPGIELLDHLPPGVVVQVDQDNGQLQSLAGLYISVGHRLAVTNHLHICLLNGVPREINTLRGFKGRERNKPANRTSSENSSQGLISHLVAPAN